MRVGSTDASPQAASAVGEWSLKAMVTESPGFAWASRTSKDPGPNSCPTPQQTPPARSPEPRATNATIEPKALNHDHASPPSTRPATSPITTNHASAAKTSVWPCSDMTAT